MAAQAKTVGVEKPAAGAPKAEAATEGAAQMVAAKVAVGMATAESRVGVTMVAAPTEVVQTGVASTAGAVEEPMAQATKADCVVGREGWVDASDWAVVLVAALVATETRAAAVAAAAESTHTSS